MKDVEFLWGTEQENAFENIKRLVSESPTMKFYQPDKQLVVQSDACQYGLGAVLLQEGQLLAFRALALSSAETRYANIEKELLMTVFVPERFHQYTFGTSVILQTDHKPLVNIVEKQLADAPKHLQSLLMRL